MYYISWRDRLFDGRFATHRWVSEPLCKNDIYSQTARSKRTPSLTSNSWGISRRARYSLASLVFISSRISSEITTCPERFSFCFLLQMSQCRHKVFGERASSVQFPLSAFLPRVWTLQLDSCRRCHLATLLLLGNVDAWRVRLPPTALRSQHAPCAALTLAQRWRAVPKDARTFSTWRFFTRLQSAWKL